MRRLLQLLPQLCFTLALWLAVALTCAVTLTGCGVLSKPLYPVPQVDLAPIPQSPVMPTAAATAPPPNGAIFQAVAYRPLFEDYRARLVGDTLTVQIVEKLAATSSSTSSVDKSGSVSGSISALPMVQSASFLARLGVGGSTSNTFAGKGSTQNSNDFTGTITVVVTGVLPNGNLLIAGEKQIGVNHNVDVLRFTGQVDPHTIQANNTVQSPQVANVRIDQRGRGAQADANAMGWLSRFFLNVLPI
jgi:flagellar L-ring protein precursor FlgH